MARYVVLEFEDNTDADDFVRAVKVDRVYLGKEHKTLSGHYNVVRPAHDFEVVGVFMRPTKPCTCRAEGKWNKQDGFTRGLKYGLWVHKCGKPGALALESWGSRLGLGRNLLSDNPLVEGLFRIDGSLPDTAVRSGKF